MNAPNTQHLIETNQQALSEELAWLRQLLKNAAGDAPTEKMEEPAAFALTLDFLADRFQLSRFERAILLLCAGIELQTDIRRLCAEAQHEPHSNYPTFSLALTVLPDPHWSALTPQAPIRYWHLIHVHDPRHITSSALSLDERILHFLLGAGELDQRLSGLIRPLSQSSPLPPSQKQQAERLTNLWRNNKGEQPLIVIQGNDGAGGCDAFVHFCAMLNLQPFMLRATDIPADAHERSLLARLLTREYLLSRTALLVQIEESQPGHLAAFLEQVECPLMLIGDRFAGVQASSIAVRINKPTAEEQRNIWRAALNNGEACHESELLQLVAQFNFSSADIATTAEIVQAERAGGLPIHEVLWQACHQRSRGGIDHLAQRIRPLAGWDDLILSKGQKAILRDICRQVRHRTTVYDAWGFAGKSERGLGISALFAGESGTGKTMAAEVLATELNLDLYRIDLSSVVSKYIGETEKNLERLFTAAESSGAILLFDEADALFGKRSEVKDSHDRYANIELAYLLQRMEAYRGLSILTSNMKSALDTAFLRRIRFVLHFPFPDLAQRAEIWQRIFPDNLPRNELNIGQLARLHVAGGNIRNIAMNAAFSAAEKGDPLCMADLAHAARIEFAKLEKPLNENELGKWK